MEGIIRSGMKKAQKFLSIQEYQDKIEEKVGIRPYPGTLNIEIESENIEEFKKEVGENRISSFEKDGKDFGGLSLYPIDIRGTEAYALEVDRSDHGDEILEVIAEENLREKFGLEDGDEIELSW